MTAAVQSQPKYPGGLTDTQSFARETCYNGASMASASNMGHAGRSTSDFYYHSEGKSSGGASSAIHEKARREQSQERIAKAALIAMDVPQDVVHLALSICKERNHQKLPSDHNELYNVAFDIVDNPEQMERYVEELRARQEQARLLEANQKKDGSHDLQEDGSGPSISESEAKLAPESSSALPEPKIQKPVAKRITENQKQEKLLEMPKATQDTSEVKAKLKERIRKLDAENRKLQHRKLCRVCRKVELAVSGVTFLPCGHYITCESCAETLDECCACGKSIMGTVRTFLS